MSCCALLSQAALSFFPGRCGELLNYFQYKKGNMSMSFSEICVSLKFGFKIKFMKTGDVLRRHVHLLRRQSIFAASIIPFQLQGSLGVNKQIAS